MTAPIVHIGYHKTATTWFQETVFPAARSHEFIPRKQVQDALLAPPGLHFDAATAREKLALDGRTRPVVLSEENLSGYLHNGGLHGLIGPEMARRIHAVLPDARIVIFIRSQPEILRATYAQYVSGGGTWSQKRYFGGMQHRRGALTRPWKAPAFEYEHFDFEPLVAFYEGLFGREKVFLYPYEWIRDEAALLSRMTDDLGIEFGHESAAAKARNVSLGTASLAVVRGANLFTRQSVVNKDCIVDLPGGQVLRHGVKRALGAIRPLNAHRLQLRADVLAKAEDLYAPGNRRLMASRGLPLDELGYPL
ncbi:hypothetical protein [Croceicoccus mobilis]|uniref:Sulfotransferase domain-containing protein n=1 Tax=Croceicoccus mobilis TaxID=1703339 RepID=A0A916Z0B7_9SPHN|nr:hypothetical protein [Croceicoccus mobilis]GGD69702.1 hypothetical protein GCM10010990_19050 [Croceicoccus mobilis]